MDITRGSLDALFTGFKANLQQGLGMATLPVESIATIIPSSAKIEQYPFLMLLSTMREWIGERQVQNIIGNKLDVVNKDFEHLIGVSRNDIEDDQVAMYASLFMKMGEDAQNLWGRLAILARTANGTWLDGKAFYVTDRKFGANTISNLTTNALSATTYAAARLAMMSYLGHNDQPLGVVPDKLIVGPKNEGTAKEIVENDKIIKAYAADSDDATVSNHVAAPNPNFKTAVVEVNPLLVGAYDDYWFLEDTKGVIKPAIVQKRKVGALVAYDQEHDENVKKRNQNEYGLHYRGASAMTLPPKSYAGIL